jgi:hypothetical protein
MKIKWGALVVDGRNKIGGHVASKNRAGSYLRTKVTPVNPETIYQLNVRDRFGGLSTAWRGLDAAERLAWNTVVDHFARTDIFGDLRNPSGFNLHQMLNNNLLNVGESAITTPPLPAAVAAFKTMSFTIENTVESLMIAFTENVATDHAAIVLATPAISPGISFVKPEYRQIAVLPAETATGYDALAEYVARFGAIGATGMQVFIRMFMVNTVTGQAGLGIAASAPITLGSV